jgi:hypothetical protein
MGQMNKQYLKNIVELIKKQAVAPPDPDGSNNTSSLKEKVPENKELPHNNLIQTDHSDEVKNRQPKSNTHLRSNTIKQMQQELINLSRDVISQINITDMANSGRAAQNASGRSSFHDFIATNYLNKSDIKPTEFDPDPKKTKLSDKSQTSPASSMSIVMDTMSRIGKSDSEFQADGIWGPKTNAALINAYAFAYGMLKLSTDFHLKPVYSQKDLAQLKADIPEDYNDFSNQEKEEKADNIIDNLKGVRELYNEVKVGILNKPSNRAYIENDQPFHTYTSPGNGFSENALKHMNDQFTHLVISIKNEAGQPQDLPITVNDLLSPQAFKTWQAKNAPTESLNSLLTSLKQNVGINDGSLGIKVGPNGTTIGAK